MKTVDAVDLAAHHNGVLPLSDEQGRDVAANRKLKVERHKVAVFELVEQDVDGVIEDVAQAVKEGAKAGVLLVKIGKVLGKVGASDVVDARARLL